mgnify:FL=1
MTLRTHFILALALATATVALPLAAQDQSEAAVETAAPSERTLPIIDAATVELDDFLWTNRLVVVFADTPADPRFAEQMQLLQSRPFDLIERSVVVLTDTDPDAESSVRTALRPRGFQVTLIGKDGEVELRKPSPWSARELSRSIDKMPLRQQEVREQKAGAG